MPGEGNTQAREPVLPSVPLPPVGEGVRRAGVIVFISPRGFKSLLSAPAGRSAECDLNNYGIKQPDRLSAPQGGSVRIPFSFYHDLELAKDPRVSVALRRTHFHGEIIYNSTRRFIHKDYKNRISLELSEGQRSGSLQISNLQEKDGNMYFCRIQVETSRCGKKVWQAINGTKLTITPGESSCPGSHHACSEAPKGHGARIPPGLAQAPLFRGAPLSNSSPQTHLLPSPLTT